MTRGNGDEQDSGNGQSARDWRDNRLDLSTKSAVVTGGARGIGRATCIALAQKGIRAVGVVDQLEDVAAFAAEVNERIGRKVLIPFRGDVRCADFRREVFAKLEDLHGPVSICVPAAGITADRLAVRIDRDSGKADLYSQEDFDRVIGVDLTAPIYWAMQTIASVAQDRHDRKVGQWEPSERVQGCIILIGSVSAAGNRGQISYAAAKSGLEGAQATLATEAIYHGVRCAIIHPGFTDTAMVRAMGEQYIADNVLPQTQLRRLIMPEEIADAICFMIRNSAVTGRLWADAGWHPTV